MTSTPPLVFTVVLFFCSTAAFAGESAADVRGAILSQMASSPEYAKALQQIRSIPRASLQYRIWDFSELPEDWPAGADPMEFQKCNPFHSPAVQLVSFHQTSLSEDRRERILDPMEIRCVYVLIKGAAFDIVATMNHTGTSSLDKTYYGAPPYANNVSAEFGLTLHQPDGTATRYKVLPTGFERIELTMKKQPLDGKKAAGSPKADGQTSTAATIAGPRATVARWLELHRTGNRGEASALTTGSDYHRAHALLPSNRDTGVRVARSLGNERAAAVVTSTLDDGRDGKRALLFWLVRRDGVWRINKSDSFELRAVDDRLRGFLEAENVRWHVERAQLVGDWHSGPGRPPGEDRPTACGIQLQLHDDNRYRLTVDGPVGPVPEYGMQGEWRVANGQIVLSCQDRLHLCRVIWMTDNSLDIEPLDNKGEVTGRARYERAVAAQDQHDAVGSKN